MSTEGQNGGDLCFQDLHFEDYRNTFLHELLYFADYFELLLFNVMLLDYESTMEIEIRIQLQEGVHSAVNSLSYKFEVSASR